MNKRRLIIVAVIVIAIAAGLGYVLMSKEKGAVPAPASTPQQSQQPTPQPSATKGSYVDYSADLVAATKGIKLLFFYAPWCPQCRMLDASIRGSTLPNNLTVFKVDYDSNQPLRSKYGVTIQTTVVKIDDAGNKLASYTAYDEPNFNAVSRALLP